jgi:hypothetical protein
VILWGFLHFYPFYCENSIYLLRIWNTSEENKEQSTMLGILYATEVVSTYWNASKGWKISKKRKM